MIHQNCIFCKVRPNVKTDQISSSLKGFGLEVLAVDAEWCLAKFSNPMSDKNQCNSTIKKLGNKFLFSSVVFSKLAFVGRG